MKLNRKIAPLMAFGLLMLSGFNAALLVALLAQWTPDSPSSPRMLDSGARNLTPGISPVAPKPIALYSETLAQPLFFKTRAPYVPPSPKQAAAPIAPQVVIPDPSLSVAGIIINDRLRKAYLFQKTDLVGMWVAEGEPILGWTVQMIKPAGITLQQNNRTIELQLYPTP